MARLTAVEVKSIDKPGRYGDCNGSYLNVAKGANLPSAVFGEIFQQIDGGRSD